MTARALLSADALLAELAERGISVRIGPSGTLQCLRADDLTSEERSAVSLQKDAIGAILACAAGMPVSNPGLVPLCSMYALPHTHWPYWTKRLRCWWIVDWPGWQVPALWVDEAAFRLTPAVHAWFRKAVDALCRKSPGSAEADWAVDQVEAQEAWLHARGLKWPLPAPVLPDVPPRPAGDVELRRDWSFSGRKQMES